MPDGAGKLLTPAERQKCCLIVKPATILAWFRQLAAKKYDSSEVRRGQPPSVLRENPMAGLERAEEHW